MKNPTPVTMVTDQDKALATKFYDLWIVGGYDPEEIAESEGYPVERVTRILRYAHIYYRKKIQEIADRERELLVEKSRRIEEVNKAVADYSRAIKHKRKIQKELDDVYTMIKEGKVDLITIPDNIPTTQTTEIIESLINDSLKKPVDDFEFSVRAMTIFRNENIKTIGDLVKMTKEDLLRTPNFGRKSLNETNEILDSMGLYLGYQQ